MGAFDTVYHLCVVIVGLPIVLNIVLDIVDRIKRED